ncbi:hypothetical protein FOZ63_014033, partial [Perkinsus olseni]
MADTEQTPRRPRNRWQQGRFQAEDPSSRGEDPEDHDEEVPSEEGSSSRTSTVQEAFSPFDEGFQEATESGSSPSRPAVSAAGDSRSPEERLLLGPERPGHLIPSAKDRGRAPPPPKVSAKVVTPKFGPKFSPRPQGGGGSGRADEYQSRRGQPLSPIYETHARPKASSTSGPSVGWSSSLQGPSPRSFTSRSSRASTVVGTFRSLVAPGVLAGRQDEVSIEAVLLASGYGTHSCYDHVRSYTKAYTPRALADVICYKRFHDLALKSGVEFLTAMENLLEEMESYWGLDVALSTVVLVAHLCPNE